MLKNVIMGDYVVPISYIDNISITESIYSPIVSGIIESSDAGFVDIVSKFKDFNLNLVFNDPDTDLDYFFSFNIHGFDNTEYDTNNKIMNKRLLKFSSFYSIKLLTNDTYLKFYNKTSYQMIKSITDIMGVKLSRENKNISHKWDFVSGNWNLNKSIQYILNRTIDNKENSGFLLFPDMMGCRLHFVNYYDILSGIIGFYNKPLVYDGFSDNYLGNIYSLNIVKEYNAIREHSKGVLNTKTVSFDPTAKNGIVYDTNNIIKSVVLNNDKLYGYIPFDNSDLSDESGTNIDTYCLNDNKTIKALKSTKYNDILMNLLTYEILVNGDYNRRLGMMTTVFLIKYANNDKTSTKSIDEKLSGSFIISDIEHSWTKNSYQQKLKCIKSGYSKTNNNLIKIK